ncbi:MAG: helix-turn-helix transcriptional regulator [Clostridia bacterium]|nr:helix-turn-helix transcriptional regulator [Clostridia bacterium]
MGNVDRQRLVEARNKHGYSQKYVALTVGVAPSIVSRWESGGKFPSRENLVKLAELYGVSVDYLLGISDDETPVTNENLSPDELRLIQDYRRLNQQGKEYIRQTMYMAVPIYIRHSDDADMEHKAIG